MNVADMRALKDGQLVRVLIPVSGEDFDGEERHLPAGSIATVDNVRFIGGPQGWGLDLIFRVPDAFDSDDDPCTIINTFDEGDDDAFAIEVAP